ncbi:hypothetical protein D3C80_1712730 [compost metagenome]
MNFGYSDIQNKRLQMTHTIEDALGLSPNSVEELFVPQDKRTWKQKRFEKLTTSSNTPAIDSYMSWTLVHQCSFKDLDCHRNTFPFTQGFFKSNGITI